MISAVVPAYNSGRHLGEALASIRAQDVPVSELIVVDDGSTDDTAQIAASFDAIYLHQENAGAPAARNRGVEAATGEFVAFLDSDDIWLPTKLGEQMAALRDRPELDMVFGHLTHFISPEVDDAQRSRLHCPPDAVPGYLPSTLLIRRARWNVVGGLDTAWEVGEFIDWLLRAREAGLTSEMLPTVVSHRRLHRSNQGVVKRDARTDYARVLKARLDRMRGQS